MKYLTTILLTLIVCLASCTQETNSLNHAPETVFANRDWASVGNGVFNSAVEGITVYNGKLIGTGNFTTINGNAISRIASFDGQTWKSLGTGLNATAENVIVFNNELYTGGFFTQAGGNNCSFIAKWNGINWTPVKGGLNRPVRSFHIFNNELIVGGSFRVAGVGTDNVQANFIATWNGSEWKSLGTGLDTVAYAMTIYNNELIVAGEFSKAGGQVVNNIAAWNGMSWRNLGTGLNNKVYGLTVFRDELIATGDFTVAGGTPARYIAKWNGKSWRSLGSGFSGPSIPSQKIEPFGRDVIVFKDRLIAGGGFTVAGGVDVSKIAYWDGEKWYPMKAVLNNWIEKMLIVDDNLYVGGFFNHLADKGFIGFAKW
jgi:hypothetical protein